MINMTKYSKKSKNWNFSGTRVFILITRVSNFVENPGLTRVLETRGPSLAGLLLPTDLRPKLVKFEIFSFFHGLELFYCKSLQVRKVTTNTFFDADSNKIVFRLDFFGPSEQFGFEASNSTKIPIVFWSFLFFLLKLLNFEQKFWAIYWTYLGINSISRTSFS